MKLCSWYLSFFRILNKDLKIEFLKIDFSGKEMKKVQKFLRIWQAF